MPDHLDAINRLKQSIFDEYDRMDLDSSFRFGCHPGVPCFNACCSDVNIFLSPYDVLRLKNRLGIDSEEFLARYTLMPIDEKQQYPVVMLKMDDTEKKSCQFVDPVKGCTVYEDRPWPCRMFPVGKASPKGNDEEPFYFLMHENVCRGWEEGAEWTVRQWLDDQDVHPWDAQGEAFKELTLHDFFQKNRLTPPQMEMFHMVCYNLDKFRAFVFGTSFLKRFHVEPETVEAMREDDEALLAFGYRWLRFALFHEPTLQIHPDAQPKPAK